MSNQAQRLTLPKARTMAQTLALYRARAQWRAAALSALHSGARFYFIA